MLSEMVSQDPVAPAAVPAPSLPVVTRCVILTTAFCAAAYLAACFLLMTSGTLVTLEQSLNIPLWFVVASNLPFLYTALHIGVWMFRKTYAFECESAYGCSGPRHPSL